MGNTYSHTSEDILWTMVGRSNDIQKLTSLIEQSRQVNITGLKKVGKSRVMVELAKRMNADDKGRYFVLFVDFENVYVQDQSALYELILDAIKVLEETKILKEFYGNDFGIAEKDPHSKPDELLKVSIKRLITSITRFSGEIQQVVLFLDNIEKLMDSDMKDIFLDFVSQIIKRSTGTKCVLASSIKPSNIKKNVNQYDLEKLATSAIIELLFEITENREGIYQRSETYTETDGCQYWFSFSNEMEIFKPENQIYINIIAKLCEGLPLAAEVSGTLLTEDHCLLEPSELVEILIMGRLSSLSPENCPPDERLDQYKDQMAQMGFKEFFDNLNENIQECEFGIVEAKEAVGDYEATTAVVKKEYIKEAMQKCVLSANKMSKEQRWIWHSVLREGQGLLQLVDLLPESEQAKEIVLRFIKNNIKTAGLDFTEDVLKDRKSLEQAILSLRDTVLTETKVVCTEDDSKQSDEIEIDEPYKLTLDQTSDEKRAIRYTRSTQESDEQINLRFQKLTCGINTELVTLKSDEQSIENQRNEYLNNPKSEMLLTQKPNSYTDIDTSEYSSTGGQFLQLPGVSSDTPIFSETQTLQEPIAATPKQALCTPHTFINTPQFVFPQSPTDNPVTSPRDSSSRRLNFLLEPMRDTPPPYTPQSPINTGNEALHAPPPYSMHQQTTTNQQTRIPPFDQPSNIQNPQLHHLQYTQQHQMTPHQQRLTNQQSHMTPHEQPANIQSPQMQNFQNTQQHEMTTHKQRTINEKSEMTPREQPTYIQSPQMQHLQNTQKHQMTTHQQTPINQQSHMTTHEQPTYIQSPQMHHLQNTQQHQMTTHQQTTINQKSHTTPHEQPTYIQSPQMQHLQNTQKHQMTTHQQTPINQQSHMTPHQQPTYIQSPQMQHLQNPQKHQMTTHQQTPINQQSHMTPHEQPTYIQSPQMQHLQNTQQHQMTTHQQTPINQQSHMSPHEQPPNIPSPQMQHFQSTHQHQMITHQQRTINQQSHMTPHEQPPSIQSPQMQTFQNTEQHQMTTHQQRTINQQSHMTPHQQPNYIQSPQMQNFQNPQQHQMTTYQQRTINKQSHMSPHEQPANIQSPQMQHFQNTQQHQMTTNQQRTINQQSHMSPHEQSANIQSPKMQLNYNFQNTQQSHHNISNRQLVQMTPQQDLPNPQSAYMTTHHNFPNNSTSPCTHNQQMHIPISESFQVLQPPCDDSKLMRQRQLSNSSQSVVSQMGLCPPVCFEDTETSLSTLREQSHVSSSFKAPMESVQHNSYENGKPSNITQNHYNLPLQSQVIHHANVLPERFTTRQQNANDLNRKQSSYLVDPNPRNMSKNLKQFLPMQSIQQNPIENITVSANTPNHQQNLPSQTQQYFSSGTSSDQLTNRQQYANDLPRSRDTHPNKNASHMSENFSATGSPAMQYIPPSWSTSLQQPNCLNTVPTQDSRFQQYSTPVQTISDMKADINDKQRLQELNPKPTYHTEPPGCQPQLSATPCWNSQYGPQDISYTTASYVGVSSQPQNHQNLFVVSHLTHGQQYSQSQSEYREGHIQQTGQHNSYHQYLNQQSEQLNVNQFPASQPNEPYTVPHNFTVSYCTANNCNTEALTSKQYEKQEVVQTQMSDTDDKTTTLMKSIL